jgi:glycerol-3-phosphate dehydrogenase
VGTTEVRDDQDPARTQPTQAEVDYLLASLHRAFPRAAIRHGDTVSAFAGVRPLPFAPGAEESAISRRSYIMDHADEGAAGLLSIVGGKLTTAAALARELVQQLGMKVKAPDAVDLPCPAADGIESALSQWARQVSCSSQLSQASARAIAEWHCRRALPIVRAAQTDERLRETLCPHTAHIVAEAVHAVQAECAVTLVDILLRRVPVALGACWSAECGRVAAERIAAVLGWDAHRTATELEQFEEERARFLVKLPAAAESLA